MCNCNTSVANTFNCAYNLYKQKSKRGNSFGYKHYWIFKKEHKKWANRWLQTKPLILKTKAPKECALENDCIDGMKKKCKPRKWDGIKIKECGNSKSREDI